MQNRSFSYDKEMYKQSMSQDNNKHPYIPKPSSPFLFKAYTSEPKIDYSNDKPLDATKFDLPHYKGNTKRKYADRPIGCLLAALVFFAVLSLVMTALFVWRLVCCQPIPVSQAKKSETEDPLPKTKTCYLKHHVINMEPLPPNIRDLLESHDTLLQRAVNLVKNRTAIATNIVYNNKVVWSKTYGALNKSAAVPKIPSSSTIFPIASVSKVFTALALFKAHSMGQLRSLDEEVVKLEPRFAVRNPFRKHAITLRELGSMRSGLPREAPCYPPRNKTNLCPHDYDTMLERIKNVSLLRQPGTEPHYSNFGYSLLGQVLAKTVGQMDFDGWMKKFIFDPLNMKDTSFQLSQRVKERLPVGYLPVGTYDPVDWGWSRPTGGAFSTIDDLAKMEIELFKGNFLPSNVVNDFLSPVYIFPNGKDIVGNPWEMTFKDGQILRYKGGDVYAYHAFIALVPEFKLAFNFLYTNSPPIPPILAFASKLSNAFKTQIQNQVSQPIKLPRNPEAYLGKYQAPPEVPTLNVLEVTLQGGALTLSVTPGGPFFTLNFIRPLTFDIRLSNNQPCFNIYLFGIQDDLIYFDEIQSGLSSGFTMYGAHPSGNSYFKRINSDSGIRV